MDNTTMFSVDSSWIDSNGMQRPVTMSYGTVESGTINNYEIYPDFSSVASPQSDHMYALVMCSDGGSTGVGFHMEWKDIGTNPNYVAPVK